MRISGVDLGKLREAIDGVHAMEMQQVVYFRALCEELNFTRAARRCNVSQPSLTRSIRLLEEEFGGALFHRERNHTHLSELGQIVKPHLDQILEQAEAASRGARGLKELTAARLKLGVMCTVAPSDLVVCRACSVAWR